MSTRSAASLWLFTALILGALGAAFASGLWMGVLASAMLAVPSIAICNVLDRKRRIGLVAIFLVGLSVRWLVCAAIDRLLYPTNPLTFAPDEGGYDLFGWWYAQFLQGRGPTPFGDEPIKLIYKFTAYCYYVFGHEILVPKMIITLLGAWSCVLTALIANTWLSSAVARRAGYLNALTPSLVLWSSLLLKDPGALLGSQATILGFLWLRERWSAVGLGVLVLGLALVGASRAYELLFLVLPIIGSALPGSRNFGRRALLFIALGFLLLFVIRVSGASTAALGESDSIMERVTMLRTGYSTGANSAIDVGLVDTSTPAGLLAWLPVGLVYFFLAPFPFTNLAFRSLATTPEMVTFYLLLPTLWRGLKRELRERHRNFMPLFWFVLFSAMGWSLVITNVGTIYRYRGQIFFVILILIAAEQIRRREARAAARAAHVPLPPRRMRVPLPKESVS